MEYRQIISITGLSGLFQLVSTKNDGAIVKSLTDDTVKFISARVHHITPLESIEIYTYEGNVRLHEVFEKIKEDDAAIADLNANKDNKAEKAFFKTVLPNFDEERVYASDIKKVLKWYAILKDKELLDFDYLKEETASSQEATPAPEENADKEKGTKTKPQNPEKPIKKKPTLKGKDTVVGKPVKKAPKQPKAGASKTVK